MMRTLDGVLRAHSRLTAPLLLKLGVQAAELDVSRGAASVLQTTEIVQPGVVLMAYNYRVPAANAFSISWQGMGFLIFDACGLVRPKPDYLSQIDTLFIRNTKRV